MFSELFFTLPKIVYICPMTENKISVPEAWNDFFKWAFLPENIGGFSKEQKHYFNKTNGDMSRGICGAKRVRNILTAHREGYCTFHSEPYFTVG